MNLSGERVALLRAVAAAPIDDTPRLVYADWLDERGGSDADAARAEFIRLGCRGTSKARILKAEGEWLEANWRRLWPRLVAAFDAPGVRVAAVRRDGRWMNARLYQGAGGIGQMVVRLECWRGFVRWVEYNPADGFERFGAAVAADEPLAEHSRTPDSLSPNYAAGRIVLSPIDCGGPGPFARLAGHDPDIASDDQKVYPDPSPDMNVLHLDAVARRIGAAMTAHARAEAGWPEAWATGPTSPR